MEGFSAPSLRPGEAYVLFSPTSCCDIPRPLAAEDCAAEVDRRTTDDDRATATEGDGPFSFIEGCLFGADGDSSLSN